MDRPLYDKAREGVELKPDSHLGLWYERFFNGYPDDWKPNRNEESKKAWAKAKSRWVNQAARHSPNGNACLYAAKRLHGLCANLGGQSRIFTGTWHFATGMGLPHPVENGFLWHPTLGLPYIPGAAVKGLVRAYIECWAEFEDENRRMETLYCWFGSEAKDPEMRNQERKAGFVPPSLNPSLQLDSEAGAFIFFDALPVSPPKLRADIMTPHMGKWYELGGEPIADADKQAERTPADWHDPNPITFLVADKPSFQFAVAPRYPDAKQELSKVMQALEQALDWLGAGAKTAVGYGLMNQDKKNESKYLSDIKMLDEEQTRRQEEVKKKDKRKIDLESMDPIDRSIELFLDVRTDKHQSETSALIQAIESGHWHGQDKTEVIYRLKRRMETSGYWRNQSTKKNPKKDDRYMNTLKVKAWIDALT